MKQRSLDEWKRTLSDVDIWDLRAAYDVYRKLTGAPYNYNTLYRFSVFLGVSEQQKEDGVIPHDAKVKIGWLLGPHAVALYKAWKVQNGKQEL